MNLKLMIMKNLLMIATLVFTSYSFGQVALGEVVGEVQEFSTGLGAVDAHVYIDADGKRYQTKADLDGRFRISAIPAGTYLLNVKKGQDTLQNVIVDVPMDGFANTGVLMLGERITEKGGVFASAKGKGIVLIDGNLPVATLSAKEIDKSPAKFNIKGLVTSMSSDVRQTEDGSLVFRGARKGDMIYLMDGVKTRDAGSVPGCSIGRMMVYTGGLPAKYGDTLGGVVVMESKSYFDLYRSWEAEQIKAGKR